MNFDAVWAFLRIYTWFWPSVILSAVASLVLSRPAAHALGTGRALASGILLSLGFVLSATLTPSTAAGGAEGERWTGSPAAIAATTSCSSTEKPYGSFPAPQHVRQPGDV